MSTAIPLVSSAAAPVRKFRFDRWWDKVSIYLPVLLMMLLALA